MLECLAAVADYKIIPDLSHVKFNEHTVFSSLQGTPMCKIQQRNSIKISRKKLNINMNFEKKKIAVNL